MNDRPIAMPDIDLETALLDLAGALAPTPAPQLAAAVRQRVAGQGAPRARGWLDALIARPSRPLRRGLVLALVTLLVLAGIAAAIGFGLPGLRIVLLGPSVTTNPSTSALPTATTLGSTPAPTATVIPTAWPVGTSRPIESLDLGQPVDPADVDAAAGRHVLLPAGTELGPPLAVFVRGSAPSTLVTAAYAATATIPAGPNAPVASGTSVAILVMELPGTGRADYLLKMLPEGTTIESLTVNGHPGFWIAGHPHELLYVNPDGKVVDEPARLVDNVLAWNDGELTFRIEGAPDLATAQRIAASLH